VARAFSRPEEAALPDEPFRRALAHEWVTGQFRLDGKRNLEMEIMTLIATFFVATTAAMMGLTAYIAAGR
jgi:hypothetical protein